MGSSESLHDRSPCVRAIPSRLLWADAAKGITILMVVLGHLTRRHYLELELAAFPAAEAFWRFAVTGLDPIRMPLFFVLSGFFAATAIKRPWAAVYLRRVVRPYYLFVLWLSVHLVFFTYGTSFDTTRVSTVGELAAQLLYPSSSLWFLYALALYFVVAFALRAFPRPLVVGVAAGFWAVVETGAIGMEAASRGAVLQNLPYFLAGAYFPDLVRRLADLASARLLSALLVAYVVLVGAAHAAQLVTAPLVMLAMSTVGVSLGVVAIVLAVDARPQLARRASRLGERTLPIYVLHMPVLALLHHTVMTLGLPAMGLLVLLYPLLAVALITGICLAVHGAVARTSLRCLFDVPAHSGAAMRTSSRLRRDWRARATASVSGTSGRLAPRRGALAELFRPASGLTSPSARFPA